MIKQTSSNPILNLRDSIAQLFGNGLAFESLNRIRMSGRGHDDKGHNGDIRSGFLQLII